MKNFLIFLSIFIIVFLAVVDAKDRFNELEQLSKYHQLKTEQYNRAINDNADEVKPVKKY